LFFVFTGARSERNVRPGAANARQVGPVLVPGAGEKSRGALRGKARSIIHASAQIDKHPVRIAYR
jgi:hypothetical protein